MSDKGKVFCIKCKHMRNFAIRGRGIYQPSNFRCMKYPVKRVDHMEECNAYDTCESFNENNDCKGFGLAGKLTRLFRS